MFAVPGDKNQDEEASLRRTHLLEHSSTEKVSHGKLSISIWLGLSTIISGTKRLFRQQGEDEISQVTQLRRGKLGYWDEIN